MLSVPLSSRDVTASWIVDVLHEAGSAPAGTVRAVEPEPLDGGSGVFGEVTRLRLSYEHPHRGDPEAVILKLPSSRAANRARAQRFKLYEREVHFYREVAPTLDLRVPVCHWSWLDPDDRWSVLVLEDLGHLKGGDLLAGISTAQAGLVVKHLARAHAQWWDSPGLAGLPWVPELGGPVMVQLASVYRELWPAFVELRGESLPPGSVALGERVRDSFEDLLTALSRPPATIAHVDFRVDNLLFGDPRGPEPVAVVDWQLASLGRGAFDVAYLLCQSMSSTQRHRQEIPVLKRWHESLVRSGVRGYSFDDAVADYRRSALVCLGCAVAGTTLDRGSERGRSIARTQAVRTFTAALDLGAHELLASSLTTG
jgi:hypothetical protein